MRGNKDSSPGRRVSVTSPPLGGVSDCFPGRSSDSQVPTYLPDFPRPEGPVSIGVRTCLPLRGSSGLSPDSLFTLDSRDRGTGPLYLAACRNARRIYCGYLAPAELCSAPVCGLNQSCRHVESGRAGQAPMGLVKREAGGNPALSRSGDGNEMLHGASQRTVSTEMGSGNRVGRPKSEDRPAATAMEALDADHVCAEEPIPWTGPVATAVPASRFESGRAGLRMGGSFAMRREPNGCRQRSRPPGETENRQSGLSPYGPPA